MIIKISNTKYIFRWVRPDTGEVIESYYIDTLPDDINIVCSILLSLIDNYYNDLILENTFNRKFNNHDIEDLREISKLIANHKLRLDLEGEM